MMGLAIDGIDVGYGDTEVLHDVSLTVAAQARVGLFGPNGHGKTTLLRTISGLLAPRSGTIAVDGEDVTGAGATEMVARRIIHVPQGSSLFPRLTVQENLMLGAHARGVWAQRKDNLARVFDIFPRLRDRRRQQCNTLSGGERQMLAIGIGLMGMPRMLMLDEPTLGLAPKIKDELADRIREILEGEMALILVDQDVEFLGALVDDLYLLEGGTVRMSLDAKENVDDAGILEMYFGEMAR